MNLSRGEANFFGGSASTNGQFSSENRLQVEKGRETFPPANYEHGWKRSVRLSHRVHFSCKNCLLQNQTFTAKGVVWLAGLQKKDGDRC